MSINYAPQLPIDRAGTPMQDLPAPLKAKVVYHSENASVSSVISVGHNTMAIEIGAVTTGVGMRWVPTTETAGVAPAGSVITAAGTANFDHFIPAGTVRRFVIPIETRGAQQGSVVGANRQNGLYQRVAYKSTAIGSVLLTEY
jgi:hypothetical protein